MAKLGLTDAHLELAKFGLGRQRVDRKDVALDRRLAVLEEHAQTRASA